jgi:hypothetical protein
MLGERRDLVTTEEVAVESDHTVAGSEQVLADGDAEIASGTRDQD